MEVKHISRNKMQLKRFNHPLLPKSIRGVIIGKSICGKTTLLINLLLSSGWLDYNRLFIFGKTLFQHEYKILKKAFEDKLPKESILSYFYNEEEINKLNVSPDLIIEEMGKDIRMRRMTSNDIE